MDILYEVKVSNKDGHVSNSCFVKCRRPDTNSRVPCKSELLQSKDYFNDSNHFNLSIPHREYTDSIVFSPILNYKHLSLITRPTRQIYET